MAHPSTAHDGRVVVVLTTPSPPRLAMCLLCSRTTTSFHGGVRTGRHRIPPLCRQALQLLHATRGRVCAGDRRSRPPVLCTACFAGFQLERRRVRSCVRALLFPFGKLAMHRALQRKVESSQKVFTNPKALPPQAASQ